MSSSLLPLSILANAAACCALLLGLAVARPAAAGAVFRCTGAHGQLAFTNKPAGYSGCKKVADYSDALAAKATPASIRHTEYVATPAGDDAADASAAPEHAAAAPGGGAAPAGQDTQVHRGAVYKITRANGVTEYTNVRPAGGGYKMLFTYISTCYACNIHSSVNWTATTLNLNAYRAEVAAAAAEFGVDPALLRAVIHAESAFNPRALSDKGAQGLMQLIPGTASDMGVQDAFDASQNIRGGAQYLAGLLKEFKGDEKLATAAYNAGPQNVLKYNGVPPFDETRVYVDRVATLRTRYHAAE